MRCSQAGHWMDSMSLAGSKIALKSIIDRWTNGQVGKMFKNQFETANPSANCRRDTTQIGQSCLHTSGETPVQRPGEWVTPMRDAVSHHHHHHKTLARTQKQARQRSREKPLCHSAGRAPSERELGRGVVWTFARRARGVETRLSGRRSPTAFWTLKDRRGGQGVEFFL